MRFLSPRPKADVEVYYAAAKSMGRPAIGQYETDLLQRFELFEQSIGRLHDMEVANAPLADIHDELKRLYDSEAGHVDAFKTKIRETFAPGCPYCGECCSTPEIDHYLPRSKYGEFSLFSPNLVPSCGPCNRKLSDRTAQNEDFLYPFADDFLQQPALKVRFDWSVDPVAVRLEVDEGVPEPNRRRLERHLDLLGIRRRFVSWAPSELIRFGRMYRGRGERNIARNLEEIEVSYYPTPGPNVWPAMLARAARHDKGMLTLLATSLDLA